MEDAIQTILQEPTSFLATLAVVVFIAWAWRAQVVAARFREIDCNARALKSAARPAGSLYRTPHSSKRDFLTYMGQFLKHKKHEWIFVAFVRDQAAVCFWVNKGRDKSNVTSLLGIERIRQICREEKCTSVWIGHNHPAGALAPSRQDRRSFEYYMVHLARDDVRLEEYVFVAGRWTKYGLSGWQILRRLFTRRTRF